MTLRITEIFYSLQGETRTVGMPTIFIRLTGCPLRCQYCDTAYAFQGGTLMTLPEIMTHLQQYPCKWVTVTGGEPLAQKACFPLLDNLCEAGYDVSLETSGAIDIGRVNAKVTIVMDIKTPGSKEADKNNFKNLLHLKKTDQIKFVLCNEQDYAWAKRMLDQYDLINRCEVLFSPSYGQLEYHDLANWIIRDRLTVRFQIQLHKILWGDVPGK